MITNASFKVEISIAGEIGRPQIALPWLKHFYLLRLREKAQELWDWLRKLEEEKYDHEQRINRQKYDVSACLLFFKSNCSKIFHLLYKRNTQFKSF